MLFFLLVDLLNDGAYLTDEVADLKDIDDLAGLGVARRTIGLLVFRFILMKHFAIRFNRVEKRRRCLRGRHTQEADALFLGKTKLSL